MPKVKITCDSTCDLSNELYERYHVDVIPLSVCMGDRLLRDGVDVEPQELFDYVEETGKLPATSAISVGEYEEFFRPFVEEGYLDADVMACQDIGKLYDLDVEGYEYAGAPDQYGKHFIHPHYINAGVLLFNMKHCRETGLFEKARELSRVKKLPFADQSALARSATKRKVIAQKYNVQHRIKDDTVIRHFAKRMFWTPYPHTENIKQWQVDKVHEKFGYTCFDDIYEEYLAIKEEIH